MNTLRQVLKLIKRTELVWRYVSNLGPTLRYSVSARDRLTAAERELVDRLDEDGIAVTSIDALVGALQVNELDRSVAELLVNKSAEIAELSSNTANKSAIGDKAFNLEILGSEMVFDPKDVFARFALNESFLRTANAYLRMVTKLRYYNVWYTAASRCTARESQLWHFDREDNYILKVFLYLDDVDDGAGPFTYAPRTHKKGGCRNIDPVYYMERGVRRTTDDQMKAVFPEENWVRATGKKGTIIFADTRGFHKGGEARSKDRLMFTCMYTSPASESKRLIHFPGDLDVSTLSRRQLCALQYK